MATLNKKKTLKHLKKKGFTDAKNKSADHHYIELFYEGRLILHTKMSHGSARDIGSPLIGKMARQCRLSKPDFMDLAKCPLSREAFINKLIASGDIDNDAQP